MPVDDDTIDELEELTGELRAQIAEVNPAVLETIAAIRDLLTIIEENMQKDLNPDDNNTFRTDSASTSSERTKERRQQRRAVPPGTR